MRISDWSSDVCSSDLLEQQILPRPVDIGSALAIARHGNIDQPRVDRRQRFIIDAEAPGDAGAVILDEDIGRLDHFEQERLALRRLEVDRDRALVAVERKEGRSEERRVGKEWVSTCRSRWSADY